MKRIFGSLLVLAGTLIATAAVTDAQSPQRTTATYDDWTLGCEVVQKICELISIQRAQGPQIPASQINISNLPKDRMIKVSVQIADNVWIANGVRLASNENDEGIIATFRWCTPGRCLADVDIKQEEIKRLRDGQSGHLKFQDASRRDVNIPISFKGLGPALDALLLDHVSRAR